MADKEDSMSSTLESIRSSHGVVTSLVQFYADLMQSLVSCYTMRMQVLEFQLTGEVKAEEARHTKTKEALAEALQLAEGKSICIDSLQKQLSEAAARNDRNEKATFDKQERINRLTGLVALLKKTGTVVLNKADWSRNRGDLEELKSALNSEVEDMPVEVSDD